MKLKFKKSHSPRSIGDVVEFKTPDEIRTANWYLSNSIAEICDGENTGGCADCEEKKVRAEEIKQSEKVVLVEVEKVEIPTPTKPKTTNKKRKKK